MMTRVPDYLHETTKIKFFLPLSVVLKLQTLVQGALALPDVYEISKRRCL